MARALRLAAVAASLPLAAHGLTLGADAEARGAKHGRSTMSVSFNRSPSPSPSPSRPRPSHHP
eukprot:9487408-Pyramimonas_sp.AAC.1